MRVQAPNRQVSYHPDKHLNQSRHNLIESKARIIFPNKIRIKNRRIRNNPVAYERARWANKNQEKRDKGGCERDLKRTIKVRIKIEKRLYVKR